MTPGRTPRVRGLVLALVAVLILMGYAFWRAAAGSRSDGVPNGKATSEAALAAPATPRDLGSDAAVAPPAGATPGGAGGQPSTGGTSGLAEPPAPPPPLKRPGMTKTTPGESSEAQLMARLRVIKDSDPTGAVTLAREGNRRFPDSADAPERTAILIHALVATDKGSEARGEAEQMVNHYPDSTWVREVEHFTGAHRHRAVGVNDAGQVIFR